VKKLVSGLVAAGILASGFAGIGSNKANAATLTQESYKIDVLNWQCQKEYISLPKGTDVKPVDGNPAWYVRTITYNHYDCKNGKPIKKRVLTGNAFVKAQYVRKWKVDVKTVAYTRIYQAPDVTYVNVVAKLNGTDTWKKLKAIATEKWGTDYNMVQYEYDLQTQAYERVKAIKIDSKVKQDILTQAWNEWGYDFNMVEYEYGLQIEAYNKLH
jgi:hypothetical protein